MAKFPGFIGGSYLSASVNAACDRAINLYPEVLENGGSSKSVGMLRACPGITNPLLTLPTSPVRAMLSAGAPLTTGARLFAVSGSKLYECFAGGTYTELGDVGNDGKPAQIFLNGTQLWCVSAGSSYLHDGVSLTQPRFVGYRGVVDTAGTAVTWVEGSRFDAALASQTVYIAGSPYTVATITDDKHLTLTGTAGTQTGAEFIAYLITGTCDMSLTKVTWRSGPMFTSAMVGQAITISGVSFTVASVEDASHLTVSASLVYFSGAPWATATTGSIAARTGAYLGGYFIAAAPDSKQFNVCDVYDGKTWDPLDYELKAGYPDNIGALLADHEELWIFGESSTELWGPNPNISTTNTFPFAKNQSGSMPIGTAGSFSPVSTRNGPAWIGADLRGQPVAYKAQGFAPVRISTHAVESVWSTYGTIADVEGFVYELDGHEFIQWTFPTADATWVYDVTASAQFGRPMWHERQSYDGADLHRHRARCHAYVWGLHLVGDYQTGAIYQMSSARYDDDGNTMYCIRVFPHLCEERVRQFYSRFQLDLETGRGTGALTVTLDWSDDGGHTWKSPLSQVIDLTAGGDPNYAARCIFNRLGSSRDRVFRVQVIGLGPKNLINAYLDFLTGTN